MNNSVIDTITQINSDIYTFVWITVGLVLLIGTGVLMSIVTKGFQIAHIGFWIKRTIGSVFSKHSNTRDKHSDKKNISQFQSLCTALAATVGVGNIAGVATAIAAGGAGAVFWMWIAALLGMATHFSESILAIYYRRKNEHGEWCGGAMYYLKDGLGSKKHCKTIGAILAGLFAVCCLLASFGIGNMSQVNTIAVNIKTTFGVETWIVGAIILVLVALVVVGGIKRIANVAEKIVPFMVILYIIGSLIIFFMNIEHVGTVFGSIFQYAFGVPAVAGGFAGITVQQVVTMGCKRGVFSNEAGLGSSIMVHSCSNVKEPVRQGMWGIFEVFTDTIIICSLTAFTVLSSGVVDTTTGSILATDAAGQLVGSSTLVSAAFSSAFGYGGSVFVTIAILLFAFTTILGWSVYGAKAWEYLFGSKTTMIYKIVFVCVVMLGAISTSSLAWDISDTFNGMMMIPNLIGVIVLCPVVYKILDNYKKRRMKGMDIEPMLSAIPEIQKAQAEAMKQDGHE